MGTAVVRFLEFGISLIPSIQAISGKEETRYDQTLGLGSRLHRNDEVSSGLEIS